MGSHNLGRIKETLCGKKDKHQKAKYDVVSMSMETNQQDKQIQIVIELKPATAVNKTTVSGEGGKAESVTAKSSYFWDEEEHLTFVSLYHQVGRKWKEIAKQIKGRTTMQSRTHGQKYLLSLKSLYDQIKAVLEGG